MKNTQKRQEPCLNERIAFALIREYEKNGDKVYPLSFKDLTKRMFGFVSVPTTKIVKTNFYPAKKKIEMSNGRLRVCGYQGKDGVIYLVIIGPQNENNPVAKWIEKINIYKRTISAIAYKKSAIRLIENSSEKERYLAMFNEGQPLKPDDSPPEKLKGMK